MLWKYQNLSVQRMNFKTTSKEREEQMEPGDDAVTEPNLILAYEPLRKLCKRLESDQELCPLCLVINQTH